MARYILSGMHGQRPVRFELQPGSQKLGRSSVCEIVLPDPAVSKQHAEVQLEGGSIMVNDLGSRNGTFVNEVRITDPTKLEPKDNLRIGHMTLKLKDQEYSTVTRLSPESSTKPQLTTSIDEAKTMAGQTHSDVMIGALHEAGQLLSKRLSLDELYESIIELLGRFVRADRIMLIDGELKDGEPHVLASQTKNADPDAPLRLSRTMLREVLESRRSFLTRDALADDRFSAQESIISTGTHAAMAAPLFDNDNILGVVYVDSKNPTVVYDSEELNRLTLLANMVAVKMTNSRLEVAEEERRRLMAEAERANQIQRNLLPQEEPIVAGYDIFAFQKTCHEVGGDLYDYRSDADGQFWLSLGDVTGKGMGAAMLMSSAMAGLQLLEEQVSTPLELVSRLHRHMARRVEMGQFVTLFSGVLDPATGELHYVNAGHNPPILLRENEKLELDSTGIPVGLLPEYTWTDARCVLNPGDTLIIFSDGVTETERGEEQYEDHEWAKFLDRARGVGSKDLTDQLLEDLDRFAGDEPDGDDLTLLIVRRLP